MGAKPQWELTHLRRAVTGNSVPMPRALLRLVLALVVPRLITRLLLTLLPPELGTYLLAAEQTVYLAGTAPVRNMTCACPGRMECMLLPLAGRDSLTLPL